MPDAQHADSPEKKRLTYVRNPDGETVLRQLSAPMARAASIDAKPSDALKPRKLTKRQRRAQRESK